MKTQRRTFTPSELKASEDAMYEYLTKEAPHIPEAQRRETAQNLAQEAGKIASYEQATGERAILVCKCGHPDQSSSLLSGHVAGIGRCKDPHCDCEEFEVDRMQGRV